MQKTLTIMIDVEPNEMMLSVGMIEPESGLTESFGPTPLWYEWEEPLKEAIGNEVVSWVKLMEDEEE